MLREPCTSACRPSLPPSTESPHPIPPPVLTASHRDAPVQWFLQPPPSPHFHRRETSALRMVLQFQPSPISINCGVCLPCHLHSCSLPSGPPKRAWGVCLVHARAGGLSEACTCPHPLPRMHQRQDWSPVLRYQQGCRERVTVSGQRTNITSLPPETDSSQACTAARRTEGRPGTEFKTDNKYTVTRE